jgi:hypothetical protein
MKNRKSNCLKSYGVFSAGLSALLFIMSLPVLCVDAPVSLFSLKKYDQNIETWFNPKDPAYNEILVEQKYQKERAQEFYKRLYSTNINGTSPWSPAYITYLFQEPRSLAEMQEILLSRFNNEKQEIAYVGYGENFRPCSQEWLRKIEKNINLKNFQMSQKYDAKNRGILIQNTAARVLPTDDVYFYHFTTAGEGYPFDNLQISSVYAGTPVYIIGKTQDSAWTWVITPHFIGWVHSETIAHVTNSFIQAWQAYAEKKLIAITCTDTPIIDNKNNQFQFASYVGSFFPFVSEGTNNFTVMIPQKNTEGKAITRLANISKENSAVMPLAATRKNFARVIKTLQNRPYGWGGMYFYNDCSLELKNLYVPFGFYLFRHSSQQIYSGKMVDITTKTPRERLDYLIQEARPLMTIVYSEGHVFLYVDKYDNSCGEEPKKIVMSYQNIWGLQPSDNSRRAILGQSLFLPILEAYPEDPTLDSLANSKIFKIIDLTMWSDDVDNAVVKPTLKSLLGIKN